MAKNQHFLTKLFYQIVTPDLIKKADIYSVNRKFEISNDEYAPCHIVCELFIGNEKTWVHIKCVHYDKTEMIGHLEYWDRGNETIEIASQAVCEISKRIKSEFLD